MHLLSLSEQKWHNYLDVRLALLSALCPKRRRHCDFSEHRISQQSSSTHFPDGLNGTVHKCLCERGQVGMKCEPEDLNSDLPPEESREHFHS